MYYCRENDRQMEYLALKKIQVMRIFRISAFSLTEIIGGKCFSNNRSNHEKPKQKTQTPSLNSFNNQPT